VGGNWFWTFALPLMVFVTLLLSAVITLLRYTKRGEYYIFGGAAMLLGLFMPLLEHLIQITFRHADRIVWSTYPLTVFIMLGGFLIFLAIYRPARELMERKFFI
jgi:VanZ family protein